MTATPYIEPESELASQKAIKRSVFWKIYFVLLTLISCFGIFTLLVDPNANYSEYISLLLGIPATVGFFGYVFSKKILNLKFWQLFLVLYVLWSVLYYFLTDIDMVMDMELTVVIISQGIGWLIALPGYVALFLYCRKSYLLWDYVPNK